MTKFSLLMKSSRIVLSKVFNNENCRSRLESLGYVLGLHDLLSRHDLFFYHISLITPVIVCCVQLKRKLIKLEKSIVKPFHKFCGLATMEGNNLYVTLHKEHRNCNQDIWKILPCLHLWNFNRCFLLYFLIYGWICW